MVIILLLMPLAAPGVNYAHVPPQTATQDDPTSAPYPIPCRPATLPFTVYNGSDYDCGSPPQERVYVTIFMQDPSYCPVSDSSACRFTPANVTVAELALVFWTGYSIDHSVTSNTTANGSLPPFGGSLLSPGQAYMFQFLQSGEYHYYCQFHPWMKGVINVHPYGYDPTTHASVGVDMQTQTPGRDPSGTIPSLGAPFSANVVASEAYDLTRWRICLWYDLGQVGPATVDLGPEWNNTLATIDIFTVTVNESVFGVVSVMYNGFNVGKNAVQDQILFSVSLLALAPGSGRLVVGGGLYSSNGSRIQFINQPGNYTVQNSFPGPPAQLYDQLSYLETPYAGGTSTLRNNFTNTGQLSVHVTSITVDTDFGTFHQTGLLPLELSPGESSTLDMTISIPATARPGNHTVTATTAWQFFNNSTWQNAPDLVISGTIPVAAAWMGVLRFIPLPSAQLATGMVLVGLAIYAAMTTVTVSMVIREESKRRKSLSGRRGPW